MAQFNLNDYETVAERLKRFLNDRPLARIETINHTTQEDRQVLTWIMEARIWLPLDEFDLKQGWYLKATGHAFEIDGQNGMANKTSALENCETSAIGRALANAGYGGDKRVSREEMAKVEKGMTPTRDWLGEANAAKSVDALRKLYNDARRASVSNDILATLTEMAAMMATKLQD
jgi:hypothetical protein